jgi:hypothetical protein
VEGLGLEGLNLGIDEALHLICWLLQGVGSDGTEGILSAPYCYFQLNDAIR